jgi:hypothetical protein
MNWLGNPNGHPADEVYRVFEIGTAVSLIGVIGGIGFRAFYYLS